MSNYKLFTKIYPCSKVGKTFEDNFIKTTLSFYYIRLLVISESFKINGRVDV